MEERQAWQPSFFCLLFSWALYYHFSTTEMPPGICQPLKIRILHILGIMTYSLGNILWKMGLCSQFAVLRLLVDGFPSKRDPRVSIKNAYFDDVPVRIYRPKIPSPEKRKGVLLFHGGGGTFGSIDAYERVCSYIVRESDVVVVSIGYRLAPEYLFPMQFEDCTTATKYFMRNAEDYGVDPALIVLSGDSIGGTITASIAQELTKRKDLPKPRAQILVGPFLQGLDFNLLSYQQNRYVPFVSQRDFLQMLFLYITKNLTALDFALAETHIPEDRRKKYHKWLNADYVPKELKMRGNYQEFQISTCPMDNIHCLMEVIAGTTISPLTAEDAIIQQLPDTFILTCEYDVLRDDGLLYKKRLEDNGVKVSWCHLKDGFHGVLLLFNRLFLNFAFSQRGIDSIVSYIKSL
ncbi:arylacetamide deacetylase-like 4 [Sceloporus undulatus]|uniref:arylacetamide deacetylase-like 4 n=1 Tax=Sceloporus undulatus TaxID=8520 RepID=UPI001C4C0B05|nr:arylacetamide deacetylase-like 4 [Sceloporus undulatus]